MATRLLTVLAFLLLIPLSAAAADADGEWYSPANENIELRRVAPPADFRLLGLREPAPERWQPKSGTSPDEYMTAPEPLVSAGDLEAMELQKPPDDSTGKVTLRLFFKEESWPRLRAESAKLVGHTIGLISSEKVLTTAVVDRPFALSLELSDIAARDAAALTQNFNARKPLQQAEADLRYEEWLVKRAEETDSTAEQLHIAAELLQRKKNDRAIAVLEPLLTSDDTNASRQSQALLVKTLLAKKEYEEAAKLYERLLGAHPELWRLKKELSAIRAQQKKFKEAHRLLAEYVELEELVSNTCELERQLESLKNVKTNLTQRQKLEASLTEQIRQNRARIAAGK